MFHRLLFFFFPWRFVFQPIPLFLGVGGGERERERERERETDRQTQTDTHTHTLRMSQWEGQRIRSGLCADSTDSPTHGSNSGTEPWDHDLSRSWMLNWQSHPGARFMTCYKLHRKRKKKQNRTPQRISENDEIHSYIWQCKEFWCVGGPGGSVG